MGEQAKRDKALDHIIDANENEVLVKIQDVTQRLTLVTDQVLTLERDNEKATDLKSQ